MLSYDRAAVMLQVKRKTVKLLEYLLQYIQQFDKGWFLIDDFEFCTSI